MKKGLILLFLLLTLVIAGKAEAKVDILALYIEAMLTEDVKTLDKILAGNYLHINANGYLQDKENFLANLKNGNMVIDRLTITDVTTSHYGSATLYTGTAQFKGKFNPKIRAGLQRLTVVAEKKDNEEKIILLQATSVTQPRSKAPAGEDKAKKK